MAFGRSKLYQSGDVVELGDVSLSSVSPDGPLPRTLAEARRELRTLRLINAQLVRQIGESRLREAQALSLADRDGLTGVYNRRRLLELLDEALSTASQQNQRVGLLFVDLDGFKGINDVFGHAVGDKLLSIVASRLAARARAGDSVCRYGGDEFIVILPKVADLAAAQKVADTIAKRLAMPYRIDGNEVRLTAAIGISMFPDEAQSTAALLRLADESMYRVKSRWTPALDGQRRKASSIPARRRDDKTKKRGAPVLS